MHTLLAAFFAMLFAHGTVIERPVAPQPHAHAVALYANAAPHVASPRPRTASGYAGSACLSCRRMNITYRAH